MQLEAEDLGCLVGMQTSRDPVLEEWRKVHRRVRVPQIAGLFLQEFRISNWKRPPLIFDQTGSSQAIGDPMRETVHIGRKLASNMEMEFDFEGFKGSSEGIDPLVWLIAIFARMQFDGEPGQSVVEKLRADLRTCPDHRGPWSADCVFCVERKKYFDALIEGGCG